MFNEACWAVRGGCLLKGPTVESEQAARPSPRRLLLSLVSDVSLAPARASYGPRLAPTCAPPGVFSSLTLAARTVLAAKTSSVAATTALILLA
jgi:hypothetical protein